MQGLWNDERPPFSFALDGERSDALIPRWERSATAEPVDGGTIRHVTCRDPVSRLAVVAHVRSFDEFPATEWLLELTNESAQDSPIIEDILPLDAMLAHTKDEKIVLHHAKGSDCRMDDFLPLDDDIWPGRTLRLTPVGGRSSNVVLPFMNLQWSDGGVVLAVGWSGQWKAEFRRDENGIRIASGMERTRIRLHPGERIRTPRILLVEWTGDDPTLGNNLLRRVILRHYTPRMNGEIVVPPVSHNTMSTYHHTGVVSVAGELEAIAKAKELGVEAYWLDACWFDTGKWWIETGNWRIRRDVFPNGLKPLGSKASEAGLDFILWFEPERVCVGTSIEREHPEFVLRREGDDKFTLLNLGRDDARSAILDTISRIITESGVTIYRQDFNFDPLPYWQEADAPDRVGMTEIRHIKGLYWFWDELKKRHPGLRIDNCASGGRRIDLETTSRSYPLWRSDFSDVGGPAFGKGLQVGCQVQTAGLSPWVPLHAASVWTFDPYDARSSMSSGVSIYSDIRTKDFPTEEAKRAMAELKRLRPYFLGEFYPLLPLTIAYHDWCAYQYHRPDLKAGFAVFFRRHESPFPTMELALRAIDADARYEVTMSETFDVGPRRRMKGTDLLGLAVTIPQRAGSLLVEYRAA